MGLEKHAEISRPKKPNGAEQQSSQKTEWVKKSYL
jgi:hypothetical protein